MERQQKRDPTPNKKRKKSFKSKKKDQTPTMVTESQDSIQRKRQQIAMSQRLRIQEKKKNINELMTKLQSRQEPTNKSNKDNKIKTQKNLHGNTLKSKDKKNS